MHQSRVRPSAAQILKTEFTRGSGARLWDTAGKSYFDFHSAYATLNQGHCHPRIVGALMEQGQKLTLTSSALPHDRLAPFEDFVTEMFGYSRVIPMNTGTEACETAVKYSRMWGYRAKGVPENEAVVLVTEGNYWGHSISALSGSSDASLRTGFGPYTPGFKLVPFGDTAALAAALENFNVVALMVEPIQGEAGVISPPPGYLRAAYDLCRAKKVLFIADEVQTAFGRTGRLTACAHEAVRPDVLVIGKALSGGVLPISAVLCDEVVGDAIQDEQHSSTFAANPLACQVAVAAMQVVVEEKLCEAAEELGNMFRREVGSWNISWLKEVRGKGLFNALELDPGRGLLTWAVSRALAEEGIVSLPMAQNVLRFTPPLVIGTEDMGRSLEAIRRTLQKISNS